LTARTSVLLPPAEHCILHEEPFLWLNDNWSPVRAVNAATTVSSSDVHDAERRLSRWSSLLMLLFPELTPAGGIIESALAPAPSLQQAIMDEPHRTGRWFVKCDHALPLAGSIKARGGFYEVLSHAENIALRDGRATPRGDRLSLASLESRKIFAQQRIVVGSTGNLGLSIGVMAAALGFQCTVHMSADAKEWKKSRLRYLGVDVIEHQGDFGAAVAAGREHAQRDETAYFVDDEDSRHLFLGYSVAALRLVDQLREQNVSVDARHPLFVYLPCGVGGAAAGITFGLRHLLGDDVHCFFAEPVASPCMLIRLASVRDIPLSVADLGLSGRTEADGLAVGKASEFVVPIVRQLASGVFTVRDEQLFEDLLVLQETEGMRIEPSAAAGFRGPRWLLQTEAGRRYLTKHDLLEDVDGATHVLWTTGGAFLPDDEYQRFLQRGRDVRSARRSVVNSGVRMP
jgi:D-serine dehydratase